MRSEKNKVKRSSVSKKEFRFRRTWAYSTAILSVVFTVLFGLLGSYEDGFTEPFIGVILLSALLGILGAYILKWREGGFKFEGVSVSNEKELAEYEGQKGLGGWLVLVGLGLFVSVGFSVYNIYTIVLLFTDGTIEFISNPSSAMYLPGWQGLLKFELIAEIGIILVALYLLYLFFTKSRKFPKYYIPFLIAVVVYVLIDHLLVASISTSGEVKLIIDETLEEGGSEIGKAFISTLAWSLYIVKSKQVKATFVN